MFDALTQSLFEYSFNGVQYADIFSQMYPLIITLFGIAAYAIFILEFYEFISTRDVFKEESKYQELRRDFKQRKDVSKALNIFVSVLEYLVLFPIVVFFWAAVFFLIIVTVSSVQDVQMILLTSVSIVGAIRICAYYSRKIAEDVAKLLPLVLLGNFVLNIKVISIEGTYNTIKAAVLSTHFQALAIHFFLLLVVLEFILRVIKFFWDYHKRKKQSGEIVVEE